MKKVCQVLSGLVSLFLLQTLAKKCTSFEGEEEYCTFKWVWTTEKNQSFYPDSDNPDAVMYVQFDSSVVHTFTSEICNVFPNLITLDIGNVFLKKISNDAFSNCTNLIYLYLGHNKLKTINFFEFNALEELEVEIDLNNNLLTDIDIDELVYKFPNSRRLWFYENHFDCNRLRIILGKMDRYGFFDSAFNSKNKRNSLRYSEVDSIGCGSKEIRTQNVTTKQLKIILKEVNSKLQKIIEKTTRLKHNQSVLQNQLETTERKTNKTVIEIEDALNNHSMNVTKLAEKIENLRQHFLNVEEQRDHIANLLYNNTKTLNETEQNMKKIKNNIKAFEDNLKKTHKILEIRRKHIERTYYIQSATAVLSIIVFLILVTKFCGKYKCK